MKTVRFLFALVLVHIAALVPDSPAQVVLALDVDERNVAPTTLAGFTSWVITSNTSATAVQTTPTVRTFGAYTVTLAGLGNPSYDDRIRTVPTNNLAAAPDFTQSALLRDVVFQGSTTNGDGLRVTIDGLTPSQWYKVTIWSYDNSSTGNRVSDWTANGFQVRSAYTFNGSILPTNDLQYQFSFQIPATPGGQLQIDGRRNAGTASAGGVFINAMRVELTTPEPPTLTSQPAGTTLYAGDNSHLLSVQAMGAAPFSYQWRRNDTDIPNATNSAFRLFNAQVSDQGDYTCVVTNDGGSITSAVATITVLPVVNLESGRLAYWPLDAVNGMAPDLTTPDAGAGANDLFLTNMTAAQLTQGIGGNALRFDGTSALVGRVHTNSVGLPVYNYPAYTVALWVKGSYLSQAGNDRRVFSESSNTNNNTFLTIGTDSAGTNGAVDIFIRNNDGGTPLNHRKSSLIAFDGNWHHIAWVDNNGFPKLYVDGVLDSGNYDYTRGTLTPTITTLGGILRTTPGNWFNGLIDDAVVYRRSLSASEIQSLLQCGPALAGSAPALTQDIASRTNNVGTPAVFEVRASGSARLGFQWYLGLDPLPGETNALLSLPNLSVAQSGTSYSVIVTNCLGTATSTVAVLTVNRPPTALPKGTSTSQGQPAALPLDKLLLGAADADGDPIQVSAVSATSTNGGSVTLTSSNVIYTPLPAFSGIDRFTYTVSDNRGGSATAHVEVYVASGSLPPPNQVSLALTPQGYLVRFAGIPGHTYQLQRSSDLVAWTTLASVVAPLHGILEFEDTNPPMPSAFYRTVAP